MAGQGTILDLAEQFHLELLALDERAQRRLIRAYAATLDLMVARIAKVEAVIAALQKSLPPGLSSTQLEHRITFHAGLVELWADLAKHLDSYADLAEEILTDAQRQAVQQGLTHTGGLISAQLPPIGMSLRALPARAIAQLVGHLADGSPLRLLFDTISPSGAVAARQALVAGLGAGLPARQIARSIEQALAVSGQRARTITRSELMRAYREASRRSMIEQPDGLVKGWMWLSARSSRTCASCWAMDGTFHTLDEVLDDHPNGRCVAVPVTKSWNELGYAAPAGQIEPTLSTITGPERFAQLTPAQQRAILGPGKYAAYHAGEITLADLVARRHSDAWGTMRHEASLARALNVAGGNGSNGWSTTTLKVSTPPASLPQVSTAPKVSAEQHAYRLTNSAVQSAKAKAAKLGTNPLEQTAILVAELEKIVAKASGLGGVKALSYATKRLSEARLALDALLPKGPPVLSAAEEQASYRKFNTTLQGLKAKANTLLAHDTDVAADLAIAQQYRQQLADLRLAAEAAGATKAAGLIAKNLAATDQALAQATLPPGLRKPIPPYTLDTLAQELEQLNIAAAAALTPKGHFGQQGQAGYLDELEKLKAKALAADLDAVPQGPAALASLDHLIADAKATIGKAPPPQVAAKFVVPVLDAAAQQAEYAYYNSKLQALKARYRKEASDPALSLDPLAAKTVAGVTKAYLDELAELIEEAHLVGATKAAALLSAKLLDGMTAKKLNVLPADIKPKAPAVLSATAQQDALEVAQLAAGNLALIHGPKLGQGALDADTVEEYAKALKALEDLAAIKGQTDAALYLKGLADEATTALTGGSLPPSLLVSHTPAAYADLAITSGLALPHLTPPASFDQILIAKAQKLIYDTLPAQAGTFTSAAQMALDAEIGVLAAQAKAAGALVAEAALNKLSFDITVTPASLLSKASVAGYGHLTDYGPTVALTSPQAFGIAIDEIALKIAYQAGQIGSAAANLALKTELELLLAQAKAGGFTGTVTALEGHLKSLDDAIAVATGLHPLLTAGLQALPALHITTKPMAAIDQQKAYQVANTKLQAIKAKAKNQIAGGADPLVATQQAHQTLKQLHDDAVAAGAAKAAGLLLKKLQDAEAALLAGQPWGELTAKMTPKNTSKAAIPGAAGVGGQVVTGHPSAAVLSQAESALDVLKLKHSTLVQQDPYQAHAAKLLLLSEIDDLIVAYGALADSVDAVAFLAAAKLQFSSLPSKTMFQPGGAGFIQPPPPPVGGAPHPWGLANLPGTAPKYMTANQAHAWSVSSWASWQATLSAAERNALAAYTGSAYVAWNRYLRNGHPKPSKAQLDQIARATEALQRGVTPEEISTYRKVTGTTGATPSATLQTWQGNIIKDSGFMSSSVNPQFAQNWGGSSGFVMEIVVPKGTKLAYVELVSSCKGEREVLFPPGTRMRVIEVLINKVPGIPRLVRVVVDM